MPPKQSNILYEWGLLNREARSLIVKTEREWESLLQKKLREESYHRYLSDHAGLFFGDASSSLLVISKLRLCPELTTDFVLVHDRYSYGLVFELIEIELPCQSPFTKSGDYSARLSHAVRQIQDWRKWIKDNPALSKKLFPSLGTRFYRNPNFEFTIIIGNRRNSHEWIEQRNEYASQLQIKIRSFDFLTDCLRRRIFLGETNFGSAEESSLSQTQRNQLANPFYKAYTDQEWREINRKMEGSAHFIAKNAESLLSARNYNTLYTKFTKQFKSNFRPNPFH